MRVQCLPAVHRANGHHATDWAPLLCSEIMDAMWKPSKFDRVYPFSTAFTFFVTVPHSVLSVLAFGKANVKQCALFFEQELLEEPKS